MEPMVDACHRSALLHAGQGSCSTTIGLRPQATVRQRHAHKHTGPGTES